ncbi:MAG: circularly permuted type 2 ATP-grasp protein, partial [Myxococcota bacterium]
WVIGDRTQAPSGAGYALENRIVMSRILPEAFRDFHVQRLAGFFQSFRDTLMQLAPTTGHPRIVLLTPGPYNETYFEHAYLARYLGVTLVEGGDLTVRDDRVYLKTLSGLLPVHVILRRQDDGFCDPLELLGESALGTPGLVQAVRSGNVIVANALGSGLVETAATMAFLPGLSRALLGEELRMPSVATWWCGQPAEREYVIEHLDELVIKPTFPSARAEVLFGEELSAEGRSALVDRIRAHPHQFMAQERVALSTVPTGTGEGAAPRHLVLRVYAVRTGDGYAVMPGGLTRVSPSPDSLVVSSQRGGGSKDTWVLADGPVPYASLIDRVTRPSDVSRASFALTSRVADNLFWLGRMSERADSGARLFRCALRRLAEEPIRAVDARLP